MTKLLKNTLAQTQTSERTFVGNKQQQRQQHEGKLHNQTANIKGNILNVFMRYGKRK